MDSGKVGIASDKKFSKSRLIKLPEKNLAPTHIINMSIHTIFSDVDMVVDVTKEREKIKLALDEFFADQCLTRGNKDPILHFGETAVHGIKWETHGTEYSCTIDSFCTFIRLLFYDREKFYEQFFRFKYGRGLKIENHLRAIAPFCRDTIPDSNAIKIIWGMAIGRDIRQPTGKITFLGTEEEYVFNHLGPITSFLTTARCSCVIGNPGLAETNLRHHNCIPLESEADIVCLTSRQFISDPNKILSEYCDSCLEQYTLDWNIPATTWILRLALNTKVPESVDWPPEVLKLRSRGFTGEQTLETYQLRYITVSIRDEGTYIGHIVSLHFLESGVHYYDSMYRNGRMMPMNTSITSRKTLFSNRAGKSYKPGNAVYAKIKTEKITGLNLI